MNLGLFVVVAFLIFFVYHDVSEVYGFLFAVSWGIFIITIIIHDASVNQREREKRREAEGKHLPRQLASYHCLCRVRNEKSNFFLFFASPLFVL